ncbi:MAG: thiosulfohydrolase SoxB [Burkholderiales bacterium]
MQRREFLRLLALASFAGASLRPRASEAQAAAELYDAPPFGNVSLLHITDTHAQLLPVYFREPEGSPKRLGLQAGSPGAYAFTSAGFRELARRYGKVGGFAHLATLVKRLRASRPHALLLDGGDSWQGSATALWTQGADMRGAQQRLGVDYMTAHWEFTYGQKPVQASPVPVLAQNVRTADFEDPVFEPYALRSLNGVPVAIIGQAFPYTPIANPRHFVPDWTFGIQENLLQRRIDEARSKGAKAVVLLSHNGRDVDFKLASRLRGLDAILGGHTHDPMPGPVMVGKTLVTNAGSNGKFVGVLDLAVGDGVTDFRYRLLPVFSRLLEADKDMAAYIEAARAPYRGKLNEELATTEGLLYRRGSFNGTFDQLIVQALLKEKGAEIAFSPGFRWGTTLLPGDAITREHLMDQTAITYPQTTLSELSGEQVKHILEDIADNVFNRDPYLRQGGDMVRVGGMTYALQPGARIGSRISGMEIDGKPLQATKRYKVAGWAPVAEGITGEPIWDLVDRHLRSLKTVPPLQANRPRLVTSRSTSALIAG